MKETPIVVDFETFAIGNRPVYPPEPVGVSIKWPKDKKPHYYAWGHTSENNCDKRNGVRRLSEVWSSNLPLLFHNSKFDVDVAETHCSLKRLPWQRVHDTLFLVFLENPHSKAFGLKPSAEEYLGMPPEERDAVRDWLLEHQPVPGVKISDGQKSEFYWGGYIAYAPGGLVGEYANGDTLRTIKLFEKLYPSIVKRGMLDSYNRERRIMPIFLDNERIGLHVDTERLNRDISSYTRASTEVDVWLRRQLKSPNLNFESTEELAEALDKSGQVTEWVLTKTGKRSTAKENMPLDKIKDPRVASALAYRSKLATCLGTFMRPWQAQAALTGGTINTSWNQVRQAKTGADSKGTRTGRPSSMRPNFLNVAKSFKDRGDGYVHPKFLKDTPELPLVRNYILPDKKHVWLHRDYNQQELRILAHFENNQILAAYRANPNLDLHTFVQEEIKRITGIDAPRLAVKMMNFGRVYGEGLGSLAERIKAPIEEIKKIREAQNRALPGLPALEKQVKSIGRRGECVVTWGGREYYVEPPIVIKDKNTGAILKRVSFEYKLLNYLIQGSAADCTKEAVIRYSKARKEGRFLVTVYDEINISCPPKAVRKEMQILRECMEGVELDVPMKSDGKSGPSWGDQTKYKEA